MYGLEQFSSVDNILTKLQRVYLMGLNVLLIVIFRLSFNKLQPLTEYHVTLSWAFISKNERLCLTAKQNNASINKEAFHAVYSRHNRELSQVETKRSGELPISRQETVPKSFLILEIVITKTQLL